MKKILITGGSGFIGSHLIQLLIKKGFDVEAPTSQELNVLDRNDMKDWKEKTFEHVIHLAGETFVPLSWEKPEKFFRVNEGGTLKLIQFCRECGINMTYISAYIYGYPKSVPIREDAEVQPNNPYAESKYMAEELCRFFCKYFGMNITILRLFNVFGPKQKENFLIPLIIKQVLNKDNTITVQDLEPKRDYIYVEDVCRAIELSIHKTEGYHLFNIGSGTSYSVREVIEIIQKIAGTDKSVISKHNIRRNELNDVVADINRIMDEWNWKPEVDFEQGLRKCMEDINE